MPISCHFRDCKALLITSLTHVSGAIASVQTFTCYLAFQFLIKAPLAVARAALRDGSVHLFVCVSPLNAYTKTRFFSKAKQSRDMVSVDDL